MSEVILQQKRYIERVLYHLSELVFLTNANLWRAMDNETFNDLEKKYKKQLSLLKEELILNCKHEFIKEDIESNINDLFCCKCDLSYHEINK